MDKMYEHEDSKVMKLAKKLGVHEDFMKYCEDKGEEITSENEADLLKEFLMAEGYTQEELKKMLASKSEDMDEEESEEMEEDEEDEKPKKGMSIAIVIGKGGKMPPAWS